MKIPVILGLAAMLSIVSCQNNDTSLKTNEKVETTELTKDKHHAEVKMLSRMIEKALKVEPSNARKAKRVFILFKESPLDMDTKKKTFMKALEKSDLRIKDQKEINHILDKEL